MGWGVAGRGEARWGRERGEGWEDRVGDGGLSHVGHGRGRVGTGEMPRDSELMVDWRVYALSQIKPSGMSLQSAIDVASDSTMIEDC